jgi:Ca-activated chloride channel homolog
MKVFGAIFIFVLLAAFSAFAQDDDNEVIKVETSLVTVPTKVTDRNERSITDLRREEFRLFENGEQQEIVGFDDAFAPFTIALVIDNSDSTRFKLSEIKRAALEFLNRLKPQDRVMVFTFDTYLKKIADGKAENLRTVKDSIVLTKTGAGTGLYDTVEQVTGDYLSRVSGKKAMIIFTDGIDTASSSANFQSSIRLAQESGVLTFPIQYSTLEDMEKSSGGIIVTKTGEPLSVAYKRGTQYLNLLADKTGGDFYYADSIKNLSKTFADIALQLSQIYNLSYYPDTETKPGKTRKIKVQVSRPKAVVKTRKVYVLN